MKLKSAIICCTLALASLSPSTAKAKDIEVRFAPDTTRVLRNPMQGWVMYLGRKFDENFWTEQGYDRMPTSEGDTVRVSDYASCAYLRTSWSSFEPEEGKYAWNDPDSRLSRLIKSVNDRGLRIAFRIVVDGRDQGLNTPQYVFDAGAKYYDDPNAEPGEHPSPYPDDKVFQEKFSKFIKAFAAEYDDPERVCFIDAYSLGKWGESHSMIYENPENKTAVFDWAMDLYTSAFKSVPLVIHYHRLIGEPSKDGWGEPSPSSEAIIEKAAEYGYILRHDAFGMNGYYQDWEKAMADRWRFRRPIIMEGGWITGAHHRYWRDPSGQYREGHSEDVRKGEYEASAQARVNMMDFRINDEVRSWFGTSMPLVRKFIKEGGYRLYPTSITVPGQVRKGSAAKITHRWENLGWGYCPTNVPQMQQRYKVAIALLDSSGTPVKISVDSATDLSKWLREAPAQYSTEVSTASLGQGTYTWAAALVDVTEGNRPAIEMAVDQSLLTPDGWLRISDVEIY